ncbi:putative protein D2-like [Ditylenchus destructor]|uniref:Phosphatidylethanolamine-binding protein n=1 Tax=Ditylenchus destructor TaxID=166010 RepID=A0AAD4MLC2_9BILA|nr:putative protein D2-like [Ditylenchus destructor]
MRPFTLRDTLSHGQITLDDVKIGTTLRPAEARDKPALVFWNREENENGDSFYALVMIDLDAPSPQYVHWLIVNRRSRLLPRPDAARRWKISPLHRAGFSVLDFAQENGLGSPMAANFFVAENEKVQEVMTGKGDTNFSKESESVSRSTEN